MATLEQIGAALKAADAAGNADDARALAAAYKQMQQADASTFVLPPEGLKPGSREYATWAVEQAKAGRTLPQVSTPPPNPEFTGPNQDIGSKINAGAGSFIEGVPLLGSTLIDWAEHGKAALHGVPVEEIKREFADDKEANPITATAGGIGGSIAALAPVGATALGGKLLGMSGSFGSRLGFGMASGGALSAADTATRGGSPTDVVTSGALGLGLGAAFPVAGAAFRKLVTPAAASAAKTAAADVLKKEGVELTAGQATGSKKLQYREAEMAGTVAQDFMEKQAGQFTSAALKRAGIAAERATPDVIDTGFSRIGQQFDTLMANNDVLLDGSLIGALGRIRSDYHALTAPSQRIPLVESLLADIEKVKLRGGQALAGPAYQQLRSRIEMLARRTSDGQTAEVLRDIRSALDAAAERWIAKYNPTDLGAWKEARRLYRNMLVIEDAAGRAGEKSADGFITPANLRNAAMKQNKRAFVRGLNEFTELANAGVSTMTPLPESGTAQRIAAKVVMPLGGLVTGAAGGSVLGPLGAIAGGAAGAMAPGLLGRLMLSGPGRAYLGNQALSGGRMIPAVAPAVLPLETTKKRQPIEIMVRGGT